MSRSSTMVDDLQEEVMENVFAFLPIHDLFRARTVCKRWRQTTLQPTLEVLRASTPRLVSTILISPRYTEIFGNYPITEWKVLDAAENRSYTLPDAFIWDHYDQKTMLSPLGHGNRWFKCTLAADKGLIYAFYCKSEVYPKYPTQKHCRVYVVCNPLRKIFHKIVEPTPNSLAYHGRDLVVMSVDNANNTYKIIIMNVHDSFEVIPMGSVKRKQLCLYDSATSVWKRLCEFPSEYYRVVSGIFFNSVFYALFMDVSKAPWCPILYTCDLATGIWSHIDIDLPQPFHPQDKLQLVVVSGRLFIVGYTGVLQFVRPPWDPATRWEVQLGLIIEKFSIDVNIWEIELGTNLKKVVKVANMVNFSRYNYRETLYEQISVYEMVVAIGGADSIVISCTMGRRVAFDLAKKCWRELWPYRMDSKLTTGGIYGGLVDF